MSNARSISEHGKISAAALIPASWHTAISVSRLIRTDTPQMSVAETGQTPSVRALPRRNATRHTRQRNVRRPFRFHFVIFLRVRTRDTYRSRQRGNFCPGLPFPERFLSPPKRRRLPSEAQRRPCQAGRRFISPARQIGSWPPIGPATRTQTCHRVDRYRPDVVRTFENVLAEADVVRLRLKEIGLELPHFVVAVTPDGDVVLRSNVSPDVLRSLEDLRNIADELEATPEPGDTTH